MRNPLNLLNIAEFRHRITFQKLVRASDGMGGFSTDWTDVITVWAKIEPLSGSERLNSERLETQRSHKVQIRYRPEITTDMRILFRDRILQVHGVHSPDERRGYTFIDAEENQGT